MKNKNSSRKKAIITLSAVLGCLIVAGIGYGSWVIVTSISTLEGNVSVTAEEVEDNRVTVDNFSVTGSYNFGPDHAGPHITLSGDDTEESLAATFTFDVIYAASFADSLNINLALTCNTNTTTTSDSETTTDTTPNASYCDLIIGQYLVEPFTSSTNYSGFDTTCVTIATLTTEGVKASDTYSSELPTAPTTTASVAGTYVTVENATTNSDGKKVQKVTVATSFGWGSYFGYVNPAYYGETVDGGTAYNSTLNNQDLDNVVDALSEIEKCFATSSSDTSSVNHSFDYVISVVSGD